MAQKAAGHPHLTTEGRKNERTEKPQSPSASKQGDIAEDPTAVKGATM